LTEWLLTFIKDSAPWGWMVGQSVSQSVSYHVCEPHL